MTGWGVLAESAPMVLIPRKTFADAARAELPVQNSRMAFEAASIEPPKAVSSWQALRTHKSRLIFSGLVCLQTYLALNHTP